MTDIWVSLAIFAMFIFMVTFFSMMFSLYIWEVMLYGWRRKEIARRLRLVMRKRRDRNHRPGMFDDDRAPDEEWLVD